MSRMIRRATVVSILVMLAVPVISAAQEPTDRPSPAPEAAALAPSPSPLPSPSPSPAVEPTSGPVLPPSSDVPLPAALQPKGRPDASATRHGVRVELWLSSSRVTPGEWVQAVVRTTNLRETPAFAKAGECGRSGTAVTVRLDPQVPAGQTFTGNAGAFKTQVLRDSLLTQDYFGRRKDLLRWNSARAAGGALFDVVECTGGFSGSRRLGPGASVIERFAWYPVGSFEDDPWLQPMWPGNGTVTVSWPYLDRAAPPSASGRRIARLVEPIELTAAIEVTGEGPSARGLPELVDLALADPRFGAWVDEDPTRRSWRGASAFAESGPAYEPSLYLWNLPDPPPTGVVFVGLERAIDRQSHRGIVTLDPWTGEVLQVECVGPSQFQPCPQPGPLAWTDDELAAVNRDEQDAILSPALIGVAASLPSALWPDAPVPASIAEYLPAAREQLWTQATDGLRLPLHLRFLEARCNSDGGVALVFEEIGRPIGSTTYAYAVRGSMPTSADDGWGGGTGQMSVLDDPEFIHLMGDDTVACP